MTAAGRPGINAGMVVRFAAVTIAVALLTAACGSSIKHANLMDQTAAGQNRCTVAKSHDRPFVVEWDATDLASFEARTQRGIVFVKYSGCEMTVLDCADPSIPGKYGKYADPQWTSGGVEQIDIKDEGELYANLPLGAASLAGKVEGGDELHLRYYVSGVATSTRDAMYASDIAGNAKCKDATHFVAAYNLGAFEISSSARDAESAKVGVGNVGAGGEKRHEEKRLKQGGKLDTCTMHDQTACRVPIRLVVRPVQSGARPPESAVAGSSTTAEPGRDPAADEAAELGYAASQKQQAGDGPACLATLDRIAPQFQARYVSVRAMCELLAGKCDDGRKHWRISMAAQDDKREMKDWDLDLKVEKYVAGYEACRPKSDAHVLSTIVCRYADGSNACKAATRAMTVAETTSTKQWAECTKAGQELTTLFAQIEADKPLARDVTSQAIRAMKSAGVCAAEAKRCGDAKALFQKYSELGYSGRSPDTIKGYARMAYDETSCKGK
jgi:hypothetical protein